MVVCITKAAWYNLFIRSSIVSWVKSVHLFCDYQMKCDIIDSNVPVIFSFRFTLTNHKNRHQNMLQHKQYACTKVSHLEYLIYISLFMNSTYKWIQHILLCVCVCVCVFPVESCVWKELCINLKAIMFYIQYVCKLNVNYQKIMILKINIFICGLLNIMCM